MRVILCRLLCAGLLFAEQVPAQERIEEIIVIGDLDSLPGGFVESVFGFDKSLLETPRSASTISAALLERFDLQDIDELIALSPGTFTQSFFGAAGGLDIRGTPGESYFRGMRRLDNPASYPTPIAAADRIDIVRGPASPIFGPSKIGGYLNIIPKSARIEETGALLADTGGAASFTTGSWDKALLSAEVSGPATLGGRDFGYYLYGMAENSGAYYDNTSRDQALLQWSIEYDFSPGLRGQFGGMFHEYLSNEISGWNRLTQDLIDHGRYVTGVPPRLDRDGDGYVSHQEFDLDGDGFTDLNPFAADLVPGQGGRLEGDGVCRIGSTPVFGCYPNQIALHNPGIAHIKGNQNFSHPDDTLDTRVTTLYFDLLGETTSGWQWANQLFFESYDVLNENSYGFSQFHDAWVVEHKLVFSRDWRLDSLTASLQVSPSIRHTEFEHGNDYTNEYFDRYDITRSAGQALPRLLATSIDAEYTEYYIGDYTDVGLAALVDVSFDTGFSALLGLRHDRISLASRQPLDKLLLPSTNHLCLPPGDCVATAAHDEVDAISWTLSLSRELSSGVLPYLTLSRQTTVIAGQGSEVSVDNIADGTAVDQSNLFEMGIKGRLADDRLYFAAAAYRQERIDFSSQSIATNQASRTEGVELEARWVVNEQVLLTAGYTRMEVINLNTREAGSRFSYVGAEDLPDIEPWALYGGALGATIVSDDARRAGIPERIYSLLGTWDFNNGWTVNGSIADVAATHSGFSRSVRLPGYTLVNFGSGYATADWSFNVNIKNVTNERYFRANFPNLYGSAIVLPELPRHVTASIRYSF